MYLPIVSTSRNTSSGWVSINVQWSGRQRYICYALQVAQLSGNYGDMQCVGWSWTQSSVSVPAAVLFSSHIQLVFKSKSKQLFLYQNKTLVAQKVRNGPLRDMHCLNEMSPECALSLIFFFFFKRKCYWTYTLCIHFFLIILLHL